MWTDSEGVPRDAVAAQRLIATIQLVQLPTGAQPHADLSCRSFSFLQRGVARMHPAVSEDEIMRVLDGRAQYERCVSLCVEIKLPAASCGV